MTDESNGEYIADETAEDAWQAKMDAEVAAVNEEVQRQADENLAKMQAEQKEKEEAQKAEEARLQEEIIEANREYEEVMREHEKNLAS